MKSLRPIRGRREALPRHQYVYDRTARAARHQRARDDPERYSAASIDFRTISEYIETMTATLPRRSFQSSELSRQPAPVFEAAEQAPVEVTRRDGEALVLMTRAEADARDSLLDFAAQLIAATLGDEGTLADRLADRFDWMLALPPADRQQCAGDLVQAARASFATGEAHLAAAEMTSWRSTARALAAGLGPVDVTWLEIPIQVERP